MATTTKKSRKLSFHSDPGHGWLAVNVRDLETLGLMKKISHYSYVRGNTVYLEEDCDYGLFLQASKEAGWNLSIKTIHYDKTAPIRSYNSFSEEYFAMLNKITVGRDLLLYNSQSKQYSTNAKITEIEGKNVRIVDEFNNCYKPLSKERLIKVCKIVA